MKETNRILPPPHPFLFCVTFRVFLGIYTLSWSVDRRKTPWSKPTVRVVVVVVCCLLNVPATCKCLFAACLTSQQHASVSQGRICSDNFTCCHTEIEVADQPVHLTQSQYTDTGPTSPSTNLITPGAWQGSHWSANFEVTCMNLYKCDSPP